MNLLDLVERWAEDKGWWVFKAEPADDGYLYVARHYPWNPYGRNDVFTLWADGKWDMNGKYPPGNRKVLEPADPDFFLKLERLITTKTK